jgi:hypothetical protein
VSIDISFRIDSVNYIQLPAELWREYPILAPLKIAEISEHYHNIKRGGGWQGWPFIKLVKVYERGVHSHHNVYCTV